MRKLMAVCLFAWSAQAADTWWVDATNGVDAAGYGVSSNQAFKTLQYACDSARSGDTIKVLPGVYADTSSDTTYGAARLHIYNKYLYFKAVGGPDATIIQGAFDSGTDYGYGGEGGVRCITCRGDVAAKSVIEGFTLRDGAASATSGATALQGGGAVCAMKDSYNVQTNGPFVVGCRIENCSSVRSGPVIGGVYVRSLFRYNRVAPGKYFGFRSTFFNCVITRNASEANNSTAHFDQCTAVNCTFADNFMNFYPTGTSWLYNCLVSFTGMSNGGGVFAGKFTDSASVHALMGPAAGDCRLRSGVSGVQIGDASYLACREFPAAEGVFSVDLHVDFYGNPIPTSGTIASGASQVAVTPAGGAVVLQTERLTLKDGVPGYANSYVYPDVYPTNYRVYAMLAGGRRMITYTHYHNGTSYRFFPLMDDSTDVIPPPDVDKPITVSIGRTTAIAVWADPAANPATADGTYEHPYPTLQQAVSTSFESASYVSSEGAVVLAKAGTYDAGVTNFTFNGYTGKTRLLIPANSAYRIIAVDGPERTFIKGAPDPDTLGAATAPGCGENAVNLVAMVGFAQLQGFTLTGGYSTTGTSYYTPGRGTLYSYGNDFEVTDCVISNNVGAYYSVGMSRFLRCRIVGNTGGSGVLGQGNYLVSCVIAGNRITSANQYHISGAVKMYHCSVVGDATSYALQNNSSAVFVNNVIDDGGIKLFDAGGHHGCVYNGFTTYEAGEHNYLKADPCFADKATGDLRIAYGSPATQAALRPGDQNASNWWCYATTDVDGRPIAFDAEGRPLPGAYSDTAHDVYVVAGQGGVAVANGRIGVNKPTAETPLVLTATAGARPVAGFIVNGTTNLFEDLPGHALTVSSAGDRGLFIEAIYSGDWYAAPDGNDAATGFYPSAAKTLKGALSNANLISGDRVLALPGEYVSGEMAQNDTCDIKARAVVPGGVTLESTGGRDVTFIRGAAATVEDTPPIASNYPVNGMGADAIRCVYLKAGSRLKGFTLTDGHTRALLNGTTADHGSADTTGGGVGTTGGDRNQSWVEDCAISNCVAFRGGGVMAAKCNRCLFANNYASYIGGAVSDTHIYNSLSRDNTVAITGVNVNSSGFGYSYTVDACTVLDGMGFANANSVCRNTLNRGAFATTATTTLNFTNCVINLDKASCNATWRAAVTGVVFTNSAAFGLDDEGRPIVGSSIAIDAADPVPSACPTDVDLTGMQRIYNGAADIGALEGDWRPTFAKDIARSSRFKVLEAGPQVTESGEKAVRLAPGEQMEAFWQGLSSGRPVPTTLTIRVTGTGTLTVTQEDGTALCEITVADGERKIPLTVPSAGVGINLSYAMVDGDTGYAEVLASEGNLGIVINFK